MFRMTRFFILLKYIAFALMLCLLIFMLLRSTGRNIALQNDQITESPISKETDVNAKDEFGCTPLHDAARMRMIGTVGALLEHGADINAQDNNGNTPLFTAIRRGGTFETIEILLKHNADANIANNTGQTPIFVASSLGYIETVKKLIESGADINIKDADGETPLTIVRAKQEEYIHEYMKMIYKDIEGVLLQQSPAPL